MNLMLAAISGQALLSAFFWILGIGGICWLLWWLIGYIAPPEPFNKFLRVAVAIIAVVFLINVIMGLVGEPFIKF